MESDERGVEFTTNRRKGRVGDDDNRSDPVDWTGPERRGQHEQRELALRERDREDDRVLPSPKDGGA